MISGCVLLANAAFLMQFIKESRVAARQARFKSGFPGNVTIFCNISFVSSEQDKLADIHLAATSTLFAISTCSPSPTRHHPPKCLLAYCKTKGTVRNQAMLLNHDCYAQHFRSRVVHSVRDSYNRLPFLPRAILKAGMARVLSVSLCTKVSALCMRCETRL